MYSKLSDASDHYPELLKILWKINRIWITEQGTVRGYEKHENDILGQSPESLFIRIRWLK